MAIIVEDGTGVDGANSYVAESAITDLFTQHGFTLPTNVEASAIRAFMLINAMEYKGSPVFDNVAFPRTGLRTQTGEDIDDESIPNAISQAQFWLMYYESIGSALGQIATLQVKKQKLGPLMQEFAVDDTSGRRRGVKLKDLPFAYVLIKPFLAYGTGTASTYRA